MSKSPHDYIDSKTILAQIETQDEKAKRKLTAAEKAEKKRRRKEYMTVFINGKQKRVKRPPTIEGMDIDEFIRQNADPIWLHQNEMWEYMASEEGASSCREEKESKLEIDQTPSDVDDILF